MKLAIVDGQMVVPIDCAACYGGGRVSTGEGAERCRRCGGSGRESQEDYDRRVGSMTIYMKAPGAIGSLPV